MNRSSAKRKLPCALSWIAASACMVAIFLLSNQVAPDSAELSEGFLEWLCRMLGIQSFNVHLIRKMAHAAEFFALEATFFSALFFTKGYTVPFGSMALTAIYSISDEIHQYFIPGRACRAKDVLIDMSGALAALIICHAAACIHRRIVLKQQISSKT